MVALADVSLWQLALSAVIGLAVLVRVLETAVTDWVFQGTMHG
jgi:hypothetical protein